MKMYTIEIQNMPSDMIYGGSPKEVLVTYLKNHGVSYKKVIVHKGSSNCKIIAKVCLLGGTRESISYYDIIV